MSSRKNKELFEAICFFGKKAVIKEMRYSEFEAVLDGVVGVSELANKTVNAAYVKINHSLMIHSIVTFTIEFNDRGFADEDWNIPLRHLAENAGPGPDLGAGPIRLACRSQCSVSWYQRELWEPSQDGVNHFVLLRDAVKRNKLGLIVTDLDNDDIPTLMVAPVSKPAPEVPVISETVEVPTLTPEPAIDVNAKLEAQAKEFQKQVDMLVQRQKQTLHGLDEKYKDEIDQVKRAMRNETQTYRHQAQELEQQANHNKVLLEKIQARNSRLERDHIQLEDQTETQKSQYDDLKDEYLTLLRNQRSSDDEESEKVVELKEQLTLKSVEMDDLKDEVTQQKAIATELQAKLASFEQQNQRVADSSSEEIESLRTLLTDKQSEAASLAAKVTQLEGSLEKITAQLESEKAKSTQESGQLSQAEVENKALEVENKALKEQSKSTEFKLQEANRALAALDTKFEGVKQELAEAEAAETSSSDLFDKMESLELVFVAYHAGAGHISLPARQLEDYLEKPLVFAAQKCSVTLGQYKSWLLHYDNPECGECHIPVKRIDTPSDFQAGVNDRCTKHRVDSGNVAMFRRSS
ncbi:hypothetical protein [Reinekea sp.]|jgi:hypothetical protein|uniref:hypothetical protein n=1 Tax=Reinekea sp. TaxID=1970455 RepID=UPI0039899EDE